jgi:putative NADH-flavin reductase
MKIFVIGATGRTGREVVEQALARGHDVTAFVRSPEAIGLTNEKLTVINGEATETDQLVKAMQNHDAVVSTLGPRKPFKPSSLLHDSAVATTHAMHRTGVKRIVVLSAAAHFPGISNSIVSFILRNHMRDSLAMEEIVQGSGLDWTIARPPRLTEGEYTTYRSREGAAPKMGFTLSRKAVAAFMLDAIDQEKHFQKIVGIAK